MSSPDVCQYEGKKNPSWDKTKTISMETEKKQQPKNKVKHIYTIESESITSDV